MGSFHYDYSFRVMTCSILHEDLQHKAEVIEYPLVHAVSNPLGTAYNHAKFLKERRVMIQEWADHLDRLKARAEVMPLHGNVA